MPVAVKAAIWNAMTEVGSSTTDPRNRASFTNLLKWQDRLKLLRSVVELADRTLPTPTGLATGTHVLRLFLAPEYYFAESCDAHVVDYETRAHVVEGLARLSADVPNMLLIPGTVSYFKPLVDKKLEKHRLNLDPTHQSRLVRYAGYYTVGEEKSTYLAHNTAYAFFNGQQVFKYRKRLDAEELNPQDKGSVKKGKVMVYAKGDRVGVFDFDKVGPKLRIGMEVCADHDAGELHKGGASNLDLQIVLSASTGMKPGYSVVRDGGCLFQCNAGTSSTDGKRRAWQNVKGELVDLATAAPSTAPAPERIDPLARQDLSDLRKRTTKLDSAYEKAYRGQITDKALPGQVTRYLQARGGTVYFYEATLP